MAFPCLKIKSRSPEHPVMQSPLTWPCLFSALITHHFPRQQFIHSLSMRPIGGGKCGRFERVVQQKGRVDDTRDMKCGCWAGDDGWRVRAGTLAAGVQVWRRWSLASCHLPARPFHFLSLFLHLIAPPSKTLTFVQKKVSSLKKPCGNFLPFLDIIPLLPWYLAITLHSVPTFPLASRHGECLFILVSTKLWTWQGQGSDLWCPVHSTVPGT